MKREEEKKLTSVTRAKILGWHAQSIPGRNPGFEQVKDEATPRRLDGTGLAVILRDNDGAELVETGLVGLVESLRLCYQYFLLSVNHPESRNHSTLRYLFVLARVRDWDGTLKPELTFIMYFFISAQFQVCSPSGFISANQLPHLVQTEHPYQNDLRPQASYSCSSPLFQYRPLIAPEPPRPFPLGQRFLALPESVWLTVSYAQS